MTLEFNNDELISGKDCFSFDFVISQLQQHLTEQRYNLIEEKLSQRSSKIIPVLERFYDEGNINAVTRTAENFGLYRMESILSAQTKVNKRITRGAHKWLRFQEWQDSSECLQNLKSQGIKIISTCFGDGCIDYRDIKIDGPIAVVFGNERDGVSETAKEMSDVLCTIPTVGFSQSLNVSVAAGIVLSDLRSKIEPGLNQQEYLMLKAQYYFNSVYKADRILKERLRQTEHQLLQIQKSDSRSHEKGQYI